MDEATTSATETPVIEEEAPAEKIQKIAPEKKRLTRLP